MKIRFLYLSLGLLCTVFLVACNTQSPVPTPAPEKLPTTAPTTVPTTPPTATPEPTLEASPTAESLPTLPPAEATVTVEGKNCAYDGPQSIPANMTFTVNWYVNGNDYDLYGLYAFIVGDGMTKEDLVAAIKREGTPPAWLTQAGSFDAGPNSSQQVTVKTAEGPLFGPLYFVCFFAESGPFRTIGPIEVK